ncbi:MAG: TetR/AcrR family transcriptional regulator [Leptospirales bacterium]|nr:TetR/AcrR family transcriptional regulator [Leptospirales bacterium]HNE25396.1 TetR/AcrR family transcriptional regulator [Leptospiraceae bacterium]HNJ04118.1 TetR/AcrR family transcriptional regulator [Leptospiraceae bacterium]HNJ34960.1 TetR/AcrR family transcriptional regulator [Leptospiraceae bacterium]HNN76821.1 TetR/AcrR family transcriptional regulator [Leptospiraceae bacterium]
MERAVRLTTVKRRPLRLPRRVRGSISRREILEAAVAVLSEKGVEGLSMRHIAQHMGCSVASPYAYFSSQEEIIRHLITEGEKKLTLDLKAAQECSHDVYVQLDAIAHAYWNFSSENRELHKLMFNMGGGRLYRQVFPSLPTSYRVFLETIREGIISGAIPYPRTSYPSIARTMWSWMYGLIVLEMNEVLRRRKTSDPVKEGIALFHHLLRSGANFSG